MTSSANHGSSFKPLHLSSIDTSWLQSLVKVFVNEHVQDYERHVHQDHRHMDKDRWKLATKTGDLRVFSERPLRQRSKSGSHMTGFSTLKGEAGATVRTALADMPVLLLVGSLQGSLEDVMYGVLNPTVESMRLKSAYVGDKFANCAVLATLEQPTASDPFRSHTVKWFEGDHPQVLRPVIKNRDFMYMEATGLAQLSTGEAVGFHVMHSVHFPDAHATPGNVRGNMAVCAVYCQRSAGVVDVFTKTTANPGGCVAPAISIKYASTALISAQKLIDCAHSKKLAWFVSHHPRQRSSTAVDPVPLHRATHDARICFVCGKNLSSRRLSESKDDVCVLCTRPVCKTCKVRRELSFIAQNGNLVHPKLQFCEPCVKDSVRVNARFFARSEFVDSRAEANSLGYTTHLASPLSSDPGVVPLRSHPFTFDFHQPP